MIWRREFITLLGGARQLGRWRRGPSKVIACGGSVFLWP